MSALSAPALTYDTTDQQMTSVHFAMIVWAELYVCCYDSVSCSCHLSFAVHTKYDKTASNSEEAEPLGLKIDGHWSSSPHNIQSLSHGHFHNWPVDQAQGVAAQDVHVTPGFRPWKQTFSHSIMAWTQHGDTSRTEDVWSSLWKRLRSSQGHARDDDDDDEV